jgi:amino acid transporter
VVARILGFCLLGEIIILMIFSFAVVVKGGGPDGIVWQALNPAALFSGGEGVEGAARVMGPIGGGLAGIGFFFAFWSWVGFEMAPNYAEEARNPKKMMAAAIYISCLGLGLFYTFWAWMLVSAYGSTGDAWPWGVATSFGVEGAPAGLIPDPATHNYANAYYPVVQDFAGVGIRNMFEVLVVTGIFACCLAFWNTSTRYLFAMGREGILPRTLGRTHSKHKSPFVAAFVTLAFTLAVYSLFAWGPAASQTLTDLGLKRSDPLVGFAVVATWLPFQGNMILFPIMAIVCLAIMWYFWRHARDGFHWFKTGVAPIIGAGSLAFSIYLMIKNRVGITFSTNYGGWIEAVPYYSVGIFLIGVVLALIYRWRSKERYEAVGKFVHEEA